MDTPTNATATTTTMTQQISQPNESLSRWQRIKQFQPSHYLVKVLFIWWMLVVLMTALQMIQGTSVLTQLLQGLCIGALAVIALLVLVDWLSLIAISQVESFRIQRHYPNNVPIYHELDIEVELIFDNTLTKKSTVLQLLQNMGVGKHIQLEFYDSYPDQLTTQLDITEASSIQQQIDSMPVVMSLDISSDTHTDSNSNDNATSNENEDGMYDNRHNQGLIIHYPVLPIERGTGYFGVAYLRLWSPFKLLRRQIILSENSENLENLTEPQNTKTSKYLRVLADFSGLLSNQLAAVFEKSNEAGIQALAQQGHGSDFLKLREYSAGDAIRQIDWKASSRHRRMMSKAYEEDNDQQIVLLLDCGEQMRHQDQANIADRKNSEGRGAGYKSINDNVGQAGRQLSYFDQVLNAALLLAYVANKQGDSVGLMTFGGVDMYIPPKKGVSLIRNLLNETADIKPTMQTSDYFTAAETLRSQLKKRSLVIIISNTRSEANDELSQAMQLLSHQHQVVFANLIEQDLDERLHGDNMPQNFEDALLYHSLTGYEQSRQHLHQYLSQKTGALCLQTTANRLPIRLTQAYLSLKR